MQKRELGKQGGGSGGSGPPAAKRGRPFGSTASNMAAAALAEAAAPSTLLGPSLQIHSSFAGRSFQNPNSVIALQSSSKHVSKKCLCTLMIEVINDQSCYTMLEAFLSSSIMPSFERWYLNVNCERILEIDLFDFTIVCL
ncbi:hypothetical protein E3N88_07789 [Mikania micrantha]|uniref:Uncharacterized protein n=1 Tax=Mikania micrantha TaxID=192012 RepID=A0A5N6PEH2_9ASTR|nr:hypothetical protein E3N88_07789 [Mikania micrantha]